jgi:hypothetical protein
MYTPSQKAELVPKLPQKLSSQWRVFRRQLRAANQTVFDNQEGMPARYHLLSAGAEQYESSLAWPDGQQPRYESGSLERAS